MENEHVLAKGLVERIGIEGSILKHESANKEKEIIKVPMEDHKVALKLVLEALVNEEYGAIASMEEIGAVGHRVVHGGEKFAESCVLTEEVIKALEDCIELAPLHNPPNLIGISACREILPEVPMVASLTTDGIESANFNKTTTEKYYTVDGQQIQKLQKGLNIIKSSDGTTRKVVVK